MTTASSRTGGFFSPKILLIVVAVIAVLYGAHRIGAGPWLTDALEWIRGLGPLAPIVFIAIYIVACVAFLPGSILTIGAGVIFGVVRGSIYVSIAATLGATAAFLVGRYLARGWVSEKLEGNPKFKAIDQAVGKEGWKIVFLTRLSPVFPFNLLNYAYGLTSVSLRDYVLASWVGMIPGTILYVYIGALSGDVARAAGGGRQTNAGRMGAHSGRLYRDSRGGSVRNTNRRAGAARKNLSRGTHRWDRTR
jgi:uncharacterized membrane protein YdjX (TVP38/TMEM64 family)